MPYAKKVVRVTLNGTMFSGNEHWSTGFFMGSAGADATAPSDAFMALVASSWKTVFTTASSKINPSYFTTGVRAALLDTSGASIPGSIKNYYETTPYAGAGSATSMPPQCALVATLVTATPRGLGSKGRMYLPGISAPVDGTGHISTTDTGTIATNLRNFFAARHSRCRNRSRGGRGHHRQPGE